MAATVTPSYVDLPMFQIVGDNCDIHQKSSHQTVSRRAHGHHWFKMYAVKDHVQRLLLSDKPTTASVATLPLATFPPNVDCYSCKCFKPVVPDRIPHEYNSLLGSRSETVNG